MMGLFGNLFRRSRKKQISRTLQPADGKRRSPLDSIDHSVVAYHEGDVIGKGYEVLGVLGVGGFSVLYLVYSPETESAYALKTLRDEYLQDQDTREQFRREAKVWVDLERHPYIVSAHFVREVSRDLGIYLVNSVNPFRLEWPEDDHVPRAGGPALGSS